MKKFFAVLLAVAFIWISCNPNQGPQTEPKVDFTTVEADQITTNEAYLFAAVQTDATITKCGFYYSTSRDLAGKQAIVGKYKNGSIYVTLSSLSSATTYYFSAFALVGQKLFESSISSFTTEGGIIPPDPGPGPGPGPEPEPTGDVPVWYELPVMNVEVSGSYIINSNDNTQYYAWHHCAGGEKAPSGVTARNYTVCFSSEHHCPVWVAAPRHSMYTGGANRTDAYGSDPSIPSEIQYSSKSTGGGCNKGHMLGSAERTCSSATNRQVFYYTNIAPQLSSGFNNGGGGWNLLEDYVDHQVCSDTLYEVLGCYFEKYTDGYGYTVSPSTISFGGRSDVSMPTMFYYVLLRTKSGSTGKALKNCSASELKCAAFVRSHTNSLKGQKPSAREMMSVSDLEKITGVTYFPNVPNAPKSTFSASDWL